MWWHPFFGWPIIRSSLRYYGMHHSHRKQEILLLERTVPQHQAIIMSYDIYRISELNSISVSHVASRQITYIQYMWFSLLTFCTSKMSKVVFCTSTQQAMSQVWNRGCAADSATDSTKKGARFSVSIFPFWCFTWSRIPLLIDFLIVYAAGGSQSYHCKMCILLLQILSNMIANLEYQTCINA